MCVLSLARRSRSSILQSVTVDPPLYLESQTPNTHQRFLNHLNSRWTWDTTGVNKHFRRVADLCLISGTRPVFCSLFIPELEETLCNKVESKDEKHKMIISIEKHLSGYCVPGTILDSGNYIDY